MGAEALAEAASEAVASEAAEDLAAVDTVAADLVEDREVRIEAITAREVRISDGALAQDMALALALVITEAADALAAFWGL